MFAADGRDVTDDAFRHGDSPGGDARRAAHDARRAFGYALRGIRRGKRFDHDAYRRRGVAPARLRGVYADAPRDAVFFL
jgi:hypothetical protein